jgi:hypothetical protein
MYVQVLDAKNGKPITTHCSASLQWSADSIVFMEPDSSKKCFRYRMEKPSELTVNAQAAGYKSCHDPLQMGEVDAARRPDSPHECKLSLRPERRTVNGVAIRVHDMNDEQRKQFAVTLLEDALFIKGSHKLNLPMILSELQESQYEPSRFWAEVQRWFGADWRDAEVDFAQVFPWYRVSGTHDPGGASPRPIVRTPSQNNIRPYPTCDHPEPAIDGIATLDCTVKGGTVKGFAPSSQEAEPAPKAGGPSDRK